MMRNDYRRSLILLRSSAAGYSGHVRLERRTLMGSMYFVVQAPEDAQELQAALVGRGRDSYFACRMGELRRDSRGQAVLCYSFDPRNICGHELEEYQLIAIAEADGGNCSIVLSGNVCGHAELNWERVRQALCLSLNEGLAPRVAEAAPQEEPEEAQDAPPVEMEIIEEEAELAKEDPGAEEAPAEAQPRPSTAGELLGIDMGVPWPDAAEPLRMLFASSLPLENAPDADYVYISVPMPAGSGYGQCAAGVRIAGGGPVSLRYALPAAWAAEPPAGLEDYIWVGDNNAGWWVTQVEL